MDTQELLDIASRANIKIIRYYNLFLPKISGISQKYTKDDKTHEYVIELYPLSFTRVNTTIQEVLAHELGHCLLDAFYSINATEKEKRRCEARAMYYAINLLMPLNEIIKVKHLGLTSVKVLSQYFRVSRRFVKLALGFYELDF